jgi:aminopeptidase N
MGSTILSRKIAIQLTYLLISVAFISCQAPEPIPIVPGVSEEIAIYRKAVISDIRYDLFFDIPEQKSDPIPARLHLSFIQETKPIQPLILDFNVRQGSVHQVISNRDTVSFRHENEHLVISKDHLNQGENNFTIHFTAGDLSLNRNEEYLYTLFVPDRASTAFPCFDQPDMKARFTLRLQIPEHWQAVTNYSLINSNSNDGRKELIFHETAPLPTYLFAFAAGAFKTASNTDGEMPMTMYYRETDSLKVSNNLEQIFELHRKSIDWMEEYTNIKYPFEKFDFVLIPPFQYGGMEHPGSIFYRERSLFLEEAATLNDKLGRASLIAHETAHIWFGDLVTMKWFNDVWSKEVFANFMADKIVNPSFPEIDHDLKFLLRHHPSAYSVDRTQGANAIRQPLANLKNAGLMYGPIIYNKAPVMMKHLEKLTGERAFQSGLMEYLKNYSYSNADWNDLIEILDTRTEKDLREWSDIWIEQPGMPRYTIDQTESGISINQEDPLDQERLWMQQLQVVTDRENMELYFDSQEQTIEIQTDDYVLLNGVGKEYGSFILDDLSIDYLLVQADSIEDNFLRGRVWLDLYESFLAGRIQAQEYYPALLSAVSVESNPQLLNQLLGQLRRIFWKFLNDQERLAFIERTEGVLLQKILESENQGIKVTLYRTYTNVFLTESSKENLNAVWQKHQGFMGMPLSSRDYTSLALALALRTNDVEEYAKYMDGQLNRLSNADMIKRLEFIKPALHPDSTVRNAFFESLKEATNREHEPWVLTALGYLHHPLRQGSAIKYLQPSLEMIEEIQITGDIFFPGRWLDTTLGGHQSEEALKIIDDFVDSPRYRGLNPKLQLKILVAADMLKRSVEMRDQIEAI